MKHNHLDEQALLNRFIRRGEIKVKMVEKEEKIEKKFSFSKKEIVKTFSHSEFYFTMPIEERLYLISKYI